MGGNGVKRNKGFAALAVILLAAFFFLPVQAMAAQEDAVPETGTEESMAVGTSGLEPEEIDTDSLADPDELFEEYLKSWLYGSRRRRQLASGTGKLAGIGLEVYTSMRGKISEVARGDSLSSRFRIPVYDLFPQTVFTAQDLGLDEDRLADGEGAVTPEAKRALYRKTGWNHKAVILALLADSPYEFYWYDKTEDFLYGNFGVHIQILESGETAVAVDENAAVLFFLPVAEAYAQDPGEYDYETEGKRMRLTLREDRTRAAADAVKTAREIVEEAAPLPDLDKLGYYRERICDLASYGADAEGESFVYGDPWQIISVFDGDDETKVVCEGYAKAFQYLCDLTNFHSEITCLSVTGTMRGGTGEGRHMWNVLQLPDGENYLADLTNCDEGTLGAPDRLFLAGADSYDDSYTFYFLMEDGGISYHYDSDTVSVYSAQDLFFAEHNAHEVHWCAEPPDLRWNDEEQCFEVEYVCGLCGRRVREQVGDTAVSQ